MDTGLVLLRLTAGFTLAAHGTQKLFGWFGGPGLEAIGQFFATLGFHSDRPLLSWLYIFRRFASLTLRDLANYRAPLFSAVCTLCTIPNEEAVTFVGDGGKLGWFKRFVNAPSKRIHIRSVKMQVFLASPDAIVDVPRTHHAP